MKAFTTLVSLVSVAIATVNAASLQEVFNFGPNPTGTRMFIYVPDVLPPNPALLVGVHWCSGTAEAFYQGSPYAMRAQQYGYIVIYPDAPASDGCWDVHSPETLSHDGGGDSLGIVSMVRYTIPRYNIDTSRIFVTGLSSGGMMTNVLLGAYPDIFAGGSSWAGIPFGCFAGEATWSMQCSTGQLIKTPQEWGDQVRAAYPGYTGPRPKMQLWHGTEDEALNYQNHLEGIKQWTNVFGYSQTPTSIQTNSPLTNWDRSIYGPKFQAITAKGVTHGIQIQGDDVLAFFGLNVPPSSSTRTSSSSTSTRTSTSSTRTSTITTTTTTTSTSTSTRTSASPSSTASCGTVPQWSQCGGINYTGATRCHCGLTCTKLNDWYYQCL